MTCRWLVFVLTCGLGGELASDARDDGQALALELRRMQPAEPGETKAELRVRNRRGQRSSLPVRMRTEIHEGSWKNHFEIYLPGSAEIERLTIVREGENAPQYFLYRGALAGSNASTGQAVSGDQLMLGVGNTDFWLADLGMEFFHWPEQRIVTEAKIKMRKGVACKVLESSNPDAGTAGYSLVHSWVSMENGGLIYAKAYNQNRELVKVFEITDVEKVNGQWRLKQMRIHNKQTRSKTDLIIQNE